MRIFEEETNTEFSAISASTLYTSELLHPFYTYRISVTAVTVLPGPYSEEITVQTLEAGKIFSLTLGTSSIANTISINTLRLPLLSGSIFGKHDHND